MPQYYLHLICVVGWGEGVIFLCSEPRVPSHALKCKPTLLFLWICGAMCVCVCDVPAAHASLPSWQELEAPHLLCICLPPETHKSLLLGECERQDSH